MDAEGAANDESRKFHITRNKVRYKRIKKIKRIRYENECINNDYVD